MGTTISTYEFLQAFPDERSAIDDRIYPLAQRSSSAPSAKVTAPAEGVPVSSVKTAGEVHPFETGTIFERIPLGGSTPSTSSRRPVRACPASLEGARNHAIIYLVHASPAGKLAATVEAA